jgi:hypothetical protein
MQSFIPDNAHPCEGYIIKVGGKFDSEYGTYTAALKAGLQLKNKSSEAQVKVYDTKERA